MYTPHSVFCIYYLCDLGKYTEVSWALFSYLQNKNNIRTYLLWFLRVIQFNVLKHLGLLSREDGRVGEFRTRLLPWVQEDNIHIIVNNPENDSKSGRTNSTVKCREESRRVKMWWGTKPSGSGHQAENNGHRKGREADYRTGEPAWKRSIYNIWHWKTKRMNFVSSHNLQGSKTWNFKS